MSLINASAYGWILSRNHATKIVLQKTAFQDLIIADFPGRARYHSLVSSTVQALGHAAARNHAARLAAAFLMVDG